LSNHNCGKEYGNDSYCAEVDKINRTGRNELNTTVMKRYLRTTPTTVPTYVPKDNPSIEDLKRIKCLYKKIVSCGITDHERECNSHPELYFYKLANKMANASLEEMHATKFPSNETAKLEIDLLEELSDERISGYCSAAKGLRCA